MRNLKIQWKGYPHNHLPRIRFVSPCLASSRSCSLKHRAAKNALSRPLSTTLIQERLKRHFKIRRRRVRSSRSSSSVARARRRASIRARQNIQIFGWDTTRADAASRASRTIGATPITHSLESSVIEAKAGPSESPREKTVLSTVTGSHDGAVFSIARKSKISHQQEYYNLLNLAEDPAYRRPTKLDNLSRAWEVSTPRRVARDPRTGLLGTQNRCQSYFGPDDIGRNRSFDSRIDPKNQTRAGARRESILVPARKSLGARQLQEKNASAQSIKSAIQSILSKAPSRTRSQRKALRQFTKGLELYVQATASLPKKSLIPSRSATTISAVTVKELNPYKEEFEAAGLAVTSDEQQRKSPSMARTKRQMPPLTPTKDVTMVSEKHNLGDPKPHSISPSTSGTTVMGWTPPHEVASGQQRSGRTSYTMSSDHTVMTFTPPHEVAVREAKPPALVYKTATKKSLPWLGRRESLPGHSSSTAKGVLDTSAAGLERNLSSEPAVNSNLLMMIPSTPNEDLDEPTCFENCHLHVDEANLVTLHNTTHDESNCPSPKIRDERKVDLAVEDNGDSMKDIPRRLEMPYFENQIIQTDISLEQKVEGNNPRDETKFTSALQKIPQTRDFASTATFSSGITRFRPFQASMALRSTHQVVATTQAKGVGGYNVSPNWNIQPAPTREAPMPPQIPNSFQQPNQISKIQGLGAVPTVTAASLSKYIEAEIGRSTLNQDGRSARNIFQTKSPKDPTVNRKIKASPRLSPLAVSPPSLPCEQYSPSLDEFPTLVPPKQNFTREPDTEPGVYKMLDSQAIKGCPKRDSIPDPMKKPPIPTSFLQEAAPFDTKHKNTDSSLPSIPTILDLWPSSSSATANCELTVNSKGEDKDVFRGLHVATAAACDEDIDEWIEEITGYGIRRFLADLSAFDGLGINALSTVARQAAKQRKSQIKAWEKIRASKLGNKTDSSYGKGGIFENVEVREGKHIDRKIGLAATDGTTPLRRHISSGEGV